LAEIRSQCQDLKIQEFLKKSDPEGSKTFWIGLSYEKDLVRIKRMRKTQNMRKTQKSVICDVICTVPYLARHFMI
jgi:hypothetical protein